MQAETSDEAGDRHGCKLRPAVADDVGDLAVEQRAVWTFRHRHRWTSNTPTRYPRAATSYLVAAKCNGGARDETLVFHQRLITVYEDGPETAEYVMSNRFINEL